MPEILGRWGVGPLFASMSGIIITVFISIHYAFFSDFNFLIPRTITLPIGIFLALFGFIMYLLSSIQLHGKFEENKLITHGFYAFSRNPIYSSWILFVIPGVVLIINSFIGILIPIFMYLLFSILVVREEKFLEREYGHEYIEYKRRIGRLIPKFF